MADPAAVADECRKIRRGFLNKLGSTGTAFTFSFELDALIALESANMAWRQLLLMERCLGHRRLDIATGDFSLDESWRALHLYGPLLYLHGRHAKARQMMELGLNPWFDGSRRRYSEVFTYIGNRDQRPKFRQRVTLLHIYQALGASLTSWPHWLEFVRTVPVEVLRGGFVSRSELRKDPALIVELRRPA